MCENQEVLRDGEFASTELNIDLKWLSISTNPVSFNGMN